MENKKMYFFYSAKQAELTTHNPYAKLNKCLVGGLFGTKIFAKICDYTECTSKNRPFGNWDDYVYVGKGFVYEVNGRKRF
jgi:hypothetical protein